MAIRSQRSVRAAFRISSEGLPEECRAVTTNPSALRSFSTFSRYARSSRISCESRRFRSFCHCAAQPVETCSSRISAWVRRASSLTRGSSATSARLWSSATRIFLNIAVRRSRGTNCWAPSRETRKYQRDQIVAVETRYDASGQPSKGFDPKGARESAHPFGVAGESHQGEDGEGQLHAEDHLAQDDEFRRSGLAVERHGDD